MGPQSPHRDRVVRLGIPIFCGSSLSLKPPGDTKKTNVLLKCVPSQKTAAIALEESGEPSPKLMEKWGI